MIHRKMVKQRMRDFCTLLRILRMFLFLINAGGASKVALLFAFWLIDTYFIQGRNRVKDTL